VPYPSHHQRRVPTTRETEKCEFARTDGNLDTYGDYSKTMGSSPEADIDAEVVHRKVELACGCYYPDVPVGGVCAACASAGSSPNICVAHYVVCRCGTPCCWKHSHPLDDHAERLCGRCHVRENNKALKEALLEKLGRAVRSVFFK